MKMHTIAIFDYSSRIRVLKVLLAMSLGCMLLAGLRVYWTQNLTYLFLVWNLFLAWVPLLIAYKMLKHHHRFPGKYRILFLAGLLWLLFFPNSPYIITDLIHLDPRNSVPLWYDAVLIFAFALTGLIAGFISLFFIHEILDTLFHRFVNWSVISFIFILSGYGIYLGRVLRWNSWSLFTHPRTLARDVATEVHNPEALLMTFVFSFVMIFSYLILHSIIHLKQQQVSHDQHKQMY